MFFKVEIWVAVGLFGKEKDSVNLRKEFLGFGLLIGGIIPLNTSIRLINGPSGVDQWKNIGNTRSISTCTQSSSANDTLVLEGMQHAFRAHARLWKGFGLCTSTIF
jgi:hypothetical protein